MKVIDRSLKQEEGTGFNRWVSRIRKIMEFGLSWQSDIEAQEVIITHLGKALSNKYILIRNVQLEGLEIPIPLILVGPPGLSVMYTSALKGVYRAKGETWSAMNDRNRKFEPARPNLITRTLLMTRAVEAFLARHGQQLFEMQSVLLFSNPGTHVDAIRPGIRVVLMDGLDRYISGLTQTRTFLNGEQIQKIVEALLQQGAKPEGAEAPAEEMQSPQQARAGLGLAGASQSNLSRGYVAFTRRINLTPGQWIFLGVMALFEILLLAGFVVYALFFL